MEQAACPYPRNTVGFSSSFPLVSFVSNTTEEGCQVPSVQGQHEPLAAPSCAPTAGLWSCTLDPAHSSWVKKSPNSNTTNAGKGWILCLIFKPSLAKLLPQKNWCPCRYEQTHCSNLRPLFGGHRHCSLELSNSRDFDCFPGALRAASIPWATVMPGAAWWEGARGWRESNLGLAVTSRRPWRLGHPTRCPRLQPGHCC